jgi:nucleotide-binding universal stress UspA family protein
MSEHASGTRPAATAAAPTYAAPSPLAPAGPIVVAVGGSHGAESALALAPLLAATANAAVHLIAVAEPPVTLDPYAGLLAYPADRSSWIAGARADVARQLARADLEGAGWPVEVAVGNPARRIAAYADATGARLIVLGREPHHRIGTRYSSRLALRLLRLAPVPVLSVMPSAPVLPRHVVVGVDFSPYSAHAARLALAFSAPDALVELVHVHERPLATPTIVAMGTILASVDGERDDAARRPEAWRGFRAALGDTGDRTVETIVLEGDPQYALLDHVRAVRPDLVATGTHGRGFLDRLVLGSVAESLLQHAPCSVLCVPGSAVAHAEHRRLATEGMRTRSVPRDEWDAALADLSRSAAGRPCAVEVDRPDVGAQRLVEGMRFAGASWDRHDGAVTLAFAAQRTAPPGRDDVVLGHAVPHARVLDLMSDADDVVHAVRIADDAGQTLLTFTA